MTATEMVRVTINGKSFMAKKKRQPKTKQGYMQKMKRTKENMKKKGMHPTLIKNTMTKMELKLNSYK